ncbi:2-oxo acid dehydrogenase subunit E2 [Caminibacter sp.]
MEYKVIMPILSDTMDKGKIVKWLVSEGERVSEDTPIVEVESDKATMDIEAGVNGIVKKILKKQGEEVPVKEPIAIIEIDNGKEKSENENNKESKTESKELSEKSKKEENKKTEETPKKTEKEESFDIDNLIEEILNTPAQKISGLASPAAKKEAAKYNLDIEELQEKGELPKPAHIKDIQNYVLKKYFTQKAWKLLEEYGIDPSELNPTHKLTTEEVLNYIREKNIPKIQKLSANQLAVIKTVENAISKPTYFIFEEVETVKKERIKLTANIIKALANAMQKNPLTRSVLENNKLLTYPASNISVAVHRDDGLYMVVIKNAESKSLEEINEWLKEIKTKKLTLNDLKGSTFGISNLGMTGIESFSALINDKDVGIAAFGAFKDGRMKVTFTFDHRIINGYEASVFVNDFKEEMKNV